MNSLDQKKDICYFADYSSRVPAQKLFWSESGTKQNPLWSDLTGPRDPYFSNRVEPLGSHVPWFFGSAHTDQKQAQMVTLKNLKSISKLNRFLIQFFALLADTRLRHQAEMNLLSFLKFEQLDFSPILNEDFRFQLFKIHRLIMSSCLSKSAFILIILT